MTADRLPILTCLAVILLGGCASPTPKSDVASAIDTPVTAIAPDAKAKSEPSGGQGPAFKPPPGFKAKIDGWDIVYCKTMTVLGSRFPKQLCMSEAQLKDHMAGNEAMRQNKDQVLRICPTPGACGEGLE